MVNWEWSMELYYQHYMNYGPLQVLSTGKTQFMEQYNLIERTSYNYNSHGATTGGNRMSQSILSCSDKLICKETILSFLGKTMLFATSPSHRHCYRWSNLGTSKSISAPHMEMSTCNQQTNATCAMVKAKKI